MKTAFKILPSISEGKGLHMLAEIGSEGLSMLYYSVSPVKVEGWLNFQFKKNIPSPEMAAELRQLTGKEELPEFNSCHIFFNFKDSMLVPSAYFKEGTAAAMLDCKFGTQPTDAIFSEEVEGMNAMNVYRVNDYVYNILNSQFLSAVFYHSQTLLLPFLQSLKEELYCTINQHSIRVVLFKSDKLQLVQYFDYGTPSDVAYHLLNTCSLHGVSPDEVKLTLDGFIDKKSHLYEELYRYFLNIRLSELPADVELSGELHGMPVHFYSHLISLVQCVS